VAPLFQRLWSEKNPEIYTHTTSTVCICGPREHLTGAMHRLRATAVECGCSLWHFIEGHLWHCFIQLYKHSLWERKGYGELSVVTPQNMRERTILFLLLRWSGKQELSALWELHKWMSCSLPQLCQSSVSLKPFVSLITWDCKSLVHSCESLSFLWGPLSQRTLKTYWRLCCIVLADGLQRS